MLLWCRPSSQLTRSRPVQQEQFKQSIPLSRHWHEFKMNSGSLIFLLSLFATTYAQSDSKIGTYWPLYDVQIFGATTEEEYQYETTEDFLNYLGLSDYLDGTSFGLELWWIVFSRLGISVKIRTPNGAKNSLSAVTQMVINGDAQVSLIPTVFVPEETKGLVITQPTHSTRYKLFVQSPTSVSTSLSLGKVFTPVLWLAIIVSMLMMGVILIFIEFVGQKAKIRSYLATPADIGQLIIVIIGVFCYQGAIQIASGCSGRVLVFTSLICGYLIYVSYNTLVISQLTTVSFKPPFDSLQDMAATGTHKLIVRNQTALLDDIKITRIKDGKRGLLADVWDQLLPLKPKAENLYNERSAVARLCKEKIALLDSELEINAATQQKHKCTAISLKDSYFRSNLGFVLSRNNTFNPHIIRLFNRMRETGIINRMRRYLDQPEVGPLLPLPALTPIELGTMVPMLVVLYMGMFISLVTLGLEIAITRGGDRLKLYLEENGFETWRDYVFFWRTIKRQRELREMENAISEEDESEEEDSDGGQSKRSRRRRRKLKSILRLTKNFQTKTKFENEIEKGKKGPIKVDAEELNESFEAKKKLQIIEDLDAMPPAYEKEPAKAPVVISNEKPKPKVLRRQDRVADLTTLLPKKAVASLTPVYLDKNIIRDQDPDSSQGSSNVVTPESRTPKVTPRRSPRVTPEHSGGSDKLEVRNNRNLVIPSRNEERPSPKPSPRYDPQDLLRPKPSPRDQAPPLPPREGPTRPARRRSDPKMTTPGERTPPLQQDSARASPYYEDEQSPERPRRVRPHEQSPGRVRVRPPLLYRNLLISLDSDGFLDGHDILDRNLARRVRENRDPDPFAGMD